MDFWTVNNRTTRQNFMPIEGTIIEINPFQNNSRINYGCSQLVTLEDFDGNIVNFVVSPSTYVVNMSTLYEGMEAIFFYDAMQPIPLIYPPRYQAVIVTERIDGILVSAGYFNHVLTSADGKLRLNIGPNTIIVTKNNQVFTQNPANHNLIVFYTVTTRSIPAQTTPDKIIVMCEG